MFGRKQFEQSDKLVIILCIGISQWLFIIPNVEICKLNIVLYFSYKWFGNLLIEKVGFRICQTPVFKIVELFYKVFVLGKQAVEKRCIKYEPFVYVGRNQAFNFNIFMRNPFTQIIQNQFLKRLNVYLVFCKHLGFIGWLFGFNNNTYGACSLIAIVYYKVVSAFGVYKVVRVVPGFL